MKRTTIVTLPDGTEATRTSATRVYTWAVMQTFDNERAQQVVTERADRLTEVLAAVRRMCQLGDYSGLVRKVSSQDGRGNKFYRSCLPGDEDDRYGYWLPDHLDEASWNEYIADALQRIERQVEIDRADVAKMAAGPRYSYAIVQWCSRQDLAMKACGNKQFTWGEYVTTTAVPCSEK